MSQAKPMRQAMPTVTEWIDQLREALGPEMVNEQIRDGMNGGTGFYAKENGIEIGRRPAVDPEKTVNLSDCQIGPMALKKKETKHGRY